VLVHTVKHGLYVRTLKPPHEKARRVSIEKLAVSHTGHICVYCQHWLHTNASDQLVSRCLETELTTGSADQNISQKISYIFLQSLDYIRAFLVFTFNSV